MELKMQLSIQQDPAARWPVPLFIPLLVRLPVLIRIALDQLQQVPAQLVTTLMSLTMATQIWIVIQMLKKQWQPTHTEMVQPQLQCPTAQMDFIVQRESPRQTSNFAASQEPIITQLLMVPCRARPSVSLVQRVNTAALEPLLPQLGIARAALTVRIELITPWNTLALLGSIALIQITLLQIQTLHSALLGLIAKRGQLLQWHVQKMLIVLKNQHYLPIAQ